MMFEISTTSSDTSSVTMVMTTRISTSVKPPSLAGAERRHERWRPAEADPSIGEGGPTGELRRASTLLLWFIAPPSKPRTPRPEQRLFVPDAPRGLRRRRRARVVATRAPDVEAVGMEHRGAAGARARGAAAGPGARPAAPGLVVLPVVDPVGGRIAVLAVHRVDDVALVQHVRVELEVRHLLGALLLQVERQVLAVLARARGIDG